MSQIAFKDGKILFRAGKIAFGDDCCCETTNCGMCYDYPGPGQCNDGVSDITFDMTFAGCSPDCTGINVTDGTLARTGTCTWRWEGTGREYVTVRCESGRWYIDVRTQEDCSTWGNPGDRQPVALFCTNGMYPTTPGVSVPIYKDEVDGPWCADATVTLY